MPNRASDKSKYWAGLPTYSGISFDGGTNMASSSVSFTGRIAGWSARNRWKTLFAAIALLVISILLSGSLGVETSEVDGVGESQKGHALIEDRFEQLPSFESVVIKNPGLDIDDQAFRSTVDSLVEDLRGMDGVANVESFYESGSPHLVSDDRHVVIARVELEKAEQDDLNDFAEGILDLLLETESAISADGFDLGVLGGATINVAQNEVVGEDFQKILLITLIGAVVILTLSLGSIVAALIPIGLALMSIFIAVGVSTFASQAKPLNFNFFEMIILMGLAVGIDYSLFIINRYREKRAEGLDKIEAIQFASNLAIPARRVLISAEGRRNAEDAQW